MLQDIYNRKLRIREFFADTMGGFSMIWQSGKKLTILNLSLFVLHAILPVSALLVLRGLIDQVIKSGVDWGHAKWQLALFAAVQLAAMAVAQLSAYWLGIQQQTISDKIAADVLRRAIKLELEQYENPEQYDELHMAQQQSLHKPAQLIAACQGIVQGLVTIALLAVFLSVVHWWLVLLVVALSVPLAVSKIMHGLQQYQLDRNCIPTQRKAQNIFHYLTTDQYAKEVRMFGFGERFIHKFQRFRTFLFIKKKQLNAKFLRQNIFIQSVEVFIATAVYCIIILSAATGRISIGGLVVYIQVFQRLQTAITGLFQSVVSLFQQQLYLRQILKYLAEPLEEVGTEASVFPPIGDGVRVSQLRFTYPGAQQAVLHDIDMLFETGKITAIVGENGAGKSTLIKLLCGLYQPTAGEVLVGGVALQRIQQVQVQEHYTAVFQDFGQYQMTVEDNITFGVQAAEPDALAHAMGKAGIAGKVASFPAAHKTQLGRTFRNGEQLSGGQWQKIALARAFYKGGDVVILDEPTSAMDPIAEHEIFGNFRKEKEGRVLILVTHRLYNLKIADKIYVLKDGVVAEEGDFDTLLHAGGVFADIYRNQAV